MSLMQYFSKANGLPTTEETKIKEESTTEANKHVAEVLKQLSRKRKAIQHTQM